MTNSNAVTFARFAHTGELKLAFEHHQAPRADAAHILFCGGFHSNMQGTKAAALLALCRQQGWHYTRFDYRGHGQSDGDAAAFTLSDWLDDTLAVIDAQSQPCVLVGSSMGGWLATLAALRVPAQAQGLLLIAAAPDFLQELVSPQLTAAHIWDLQQGQAIELANRYDSPHPITQALIDSGIALSLLQGSALEQLHCPVRLIHGTADNDVPFELSVRLMDKLPSGHDARVSLLHGADHRLSDESSLTYIQSELRQLVAQLENNSHNNSPL